MVGALSRGSRYGLPETLMPVNSNVTLASGDLVNIQAGQLEVVDAGERILGVIKQSATSATDNCQVIVTPGLQIVMDNDNLVTTFGATHVGTYFDTIGATGAQVVDTSTTIGSEVTTQSAQLLCLGYNPQLGGDYDADVSIGLFMIFESVWTK